MINISNIIKSSIELDPWPYKLIDNILDPDTFNTIVDGTKILAENAITEKRDPNGLWMFKAKEYGVKQEVIDLVMDMNIQLLTEYKKVLSSFPKAMHTQTGYFSIPRFNFIGPYVDGSIHDEGDSKTMAMVIYLTPEKTEGTRLYTEESYDTYVKSIEWKPNRAFMMCSLPGTTWHSFHSDHQPRMTLNFYYERMEKMPYINNLGEEKMLWFYEELAKGKISVSL